MNQHKVDYGVEKLSEIAKYIYVIHIILAFCSLTADTVIMQITPIFVLGTGGIVLVYRLLHIKSYSSYPFIWMYVLFVALYGVTSLLNLSYGLTGNVKIMVWMTLQFGVLYVCDRNKDRRKMEREMKISLLILLVMTTVMNIIGLAMLLTDHCSFRIISEDRSYLLGIAYWGRLYGVHTDPNYGSVLTAAAIIAAVYFIMKSRYAAVKAAAVLCCAVNIFHLVFSASRTGLVTLMVSGAVYTFIYVLQKRKKAVSAAVLAVLCAAAVFVGSQGITNGYNYLASLESVQVEEPEEPTEETDKEETQATVSEQDVKEETEKNDLTEIGRTEELSGDISNRRFDLWKNGLQIVKTAPLMGISFANIVPYCKSELPDSYLLTNGYTVFNAFHNMFVDLVVSQGVIGFALFILIIVVSLRYLWKNKKYIAGDDSLNCCMLFSMAAGMISSSLFVSEILYVHNHISVLFWMVWGYLICCFEMNRKQNS